MVQPNRTNIIPDSNEISSFTVFTLVDITDSGVKIPSPKNNIGYNQTQNLHVLIQTIGLRSQPMSLTVNKRENQSMSDYEFGSIFDGTKNTVWAVEFTTEHPYAWYKEGNPVWHLADDCNMVAIISGLDETQQFQSDVFVTEVSTHTNTYFRAKYHTR